MRTSKKTIIKILGFAASFILSVLLLTFLLTPPSGIRVLLKQAKEGDYDVLIMGQSHAECGYNPYIISEGLEVNAVSVARRITPINNIYYILQEADVSKQYNMVILDVDPYYWVLDQTRDSGSDMNLMPYLTGMRQYHYFREAIWPQRFTMLFCDYMLSGENILKIPSCISAKLDTDYRENNDNAMLAVNRYLKSDTAFTYEGRGFLRGVERATELGWEPFEFTGTVEQDNIDYLIRIKQYCDDNNIRLVCVESALNPYRLRIQDMGQIHDYFDNMLGAMGIEFYDFNYAKSEYLHRTDEDYVDVDGHMMGDVADRQSQLFVEVMQSEDSKRYFYDSYVEVLKNL